MPVATTVPMVAAPATMTAIAVRETSAGVATSCHAVKADLSVLRVGTDGAAAAAAAGASVFQIASVESVSSSAKFLNVGYHYINSILALAIPYSMSDEDIKEMMKK